jgi:hypothetical protein
MCLADSGQICCDQPLLANLDLWVHSLVREAEVDLAWVRHKANNP